MTKWIKWTLSFMTIKWWLSIFFACMIYFGIFLVPSVGGTKEGGFLLAMTGIAIAVLSFAATISTLFTDSEKIDNIFYSYKNKFTSHYRKWWDAKPDNK